MPKRDINPNPNPDDEMSITWVTDVAHLPKGDVTQAPGTIGPLMEYGVLTCVSIVEEGVMTRLAEPHRWIDHGPRIRDAVRAAVDLEGWETSSDQ